MRSDGLAALTRATTPHNQSERLWRGVWGTTFLVGGVVDIWRMTQHDETTLSASIRHLFRTDTITGRVLFLSALGVFARHILN